MKKILVEIEINVPDEDETNLDALEEYFNRVIEDTGENIVEVKDWIVMVSKQ